MNLVVVALYAQGHHAQYVRYLVQAWGAGGFEREGHRLHLVLGSTYPARAPGLLTLAAGTPGVEAHVASTTAQADEETGAMSLLDRDRLHGRVAAEYAGRLGADHVLFTFMDHAQLSLARGLRTPRPVPVSGIYFRSSFHYGALGGPAPTFGERVRALRKQLVLRAALRNPDLRYVFSLDPFAVPYLTRWARRAEGVALPDPVDALDRSAGKSGGDPAPRFAGDRRRLLLFGMLDGRKGVREVIGALERLPAPQQQRLSLRLAGPLETSERIDLLERIDRLRAGTGVDVRLDDRFIAEEELQPLVSESDLVFVTYQRHVGSSNVLVRAAAAGVPVLASDYGLVGAQVRARRLGVALDATRPEAIANALSAWLDDARAIPFDAHSARAFADENTAHAFADTIFSRLLAPV